MIISYIILYVKYAGASAYGFFGLMKEKLNIFRDFTLECSETSPPF